MKIKFRAAVVTGFAAVISITSAATPAVAAGTVVSVGQGTLIARGTGVTVPTTFTCDPGQIYSVAVGLSQRLGGGRLAQGSNGSIDFPSCTGQTQAVTVTVLAQTLAFKAGTALAIVSLTTCEPDFSVCQSQELTAPIRLRK
jgi:hypothetical protein